MTNTNTFAANSTLSNIRSLALRIRNREAFAAHCARCPQPVEQARAARLLAEAAELRAERAALQDAAEAAWQAAR